MSDFSFTPFSINAKKNMCLSGGAHTMYKNMCSSAALPHFKHYWLIHHCLMGVCNIRTHAFLLTHFLEALPDLLHLLSTDL